MSLYPSFILQTYQYECECVSENNTPPIDFDPNFISEMSTPEMINATILANYALGLCLRIVLWGKIKKCLKRRICILLLIHYGVLVLFPNAKFNSIQNYLCNHVDITIDHSI